MHDPSTFEARPECPRVHCACRFVLTLVVLLLPVVIAFASEQDAAELVFVVLDRAIVKAEPAFFSESIAEVGEGEQLLQESRQDGWARVRVDGRTGYIHASALRDREENRRFNEVFGLPESERDTYAAQKGFGPEVERSYGANTDLDYGPVDRWVAKTRAHDVSPSLAAFRREGGLGEFAEIER